MIPGGVTDLEMTGMLLRFEYLHRRITRLEFETAPAPKNVLPGEVIHMVAHPEYPSQDMYQF